MGYLELIALLLALASGSAVQQDSFKVNITRTSDQFIPEIEFKEFKTVVAFVKMARNSKQQPNALLSMDQQNCTLSSRHSLCSFESASSKSRFALKCLTLPCIFTLVFESREPAVSVADKKQPFAVLPKCETTSAVLLELQDSLLAEDFQHKSGVYLQSKPKAIYSYGDSTVVLVSPHKEDIKFLFDSEDKVVTSTSLEFYQMKTLEADLAKEGVQEFPQVLIVEEQALVTRFSKELNKYVYLLVKFEPLAEAANFSITFELPTVSRLSTIYAPDTDLVFHTWLVEKSVIQQAIAQSAVSGYSKEGSLKLEKGQLLLKIRSTVPLRASVNLQISDSLSLNAEQFLFTEVSGTYQLKFTNTVAKKKLKETEVVIKDYDDSAKQYPTKPEHCLYGLPCSVEVNTSGHEVGLTVTSRAKAVKSKCAQGSEEESIVLQAHKPVCFVHQRADTADKKIEVDEEGVALYVSFRKECQVPSEKCHDMQGSKDSPVILGGSEAKLPTLYLSLASSRTKEVTYKLSNYTVDYSRLQLNEELEAVMSENEVDQFYFEPQSSGALTFKLRAPPHALLMRVASGKGQEVSTSEEAEVKVQKGEKVVVEISRIDPDDYEPINYKVLVFEVGAVRVLTNNDVMVGVLEGKSAFLAYVAIRKEDYLLNFWSEAPPGQPVAVIRVVKRAFKKEYEISSNTTLDLNSALDQACASVPEDDCQVQLILEPKTTTPYQFSFVLYEQDAAVQIILGSTTHLSGLLLSAKSHFYLRHAGTTPLTLVASTPVGGLGIAAVSACQSPRTPVEQYPYPQAASVDSTQKNAHLVIESFAKCEHESHSVVLITLSRSKEAQEPILLLAWTDTLVLGNQQGQQVTLSNGSKFLSYDLSSVLRKKVAVQILVESLGGNCLVSYFLSSTKHPIDFSQPNYLGEEVVLPYSAIVKRLQERQIGLDQQVSLVIELEAESWSGFVMVSESMEELNLVMMEVPTLISLEKGQEEVFLLDNPNGDNLRVKLTLLQGTPKVRLVGCEGKHRLDKECLGKVRDGKKDQTTLLKSEELDLGKMQIFKYYYLAVRAQETVDLSLYYFTETSSILLMEAVLYDDFLQAEETENYRLAVIEDQLVLQIVVTQGDLVASTSSLGQLVELSPVNKTIQHRFNLRKARVQAYQIILAVRCISACTFKIGYFRKPQSQFELVDGQQTAVELDEKVRARTFTFTTQNETGFLVLSSREQDGLSNLILTITLEEIKETEGPQAQISSDKLVTDQRSLYGSTATLELPINKTVFIRFQSKQGSLQLLVQAYVRMVLELPIDLMSQYVISRDRSATFFSRAMNETYLLLKFRGCTLAKVTLGLAFSKEALEDSDFTHEYQVEDGGFVKAVKVPEGELYLQLTTQSREMMPFKLSGSFMSKSAADKAMASAEPEAGRGGEIEFKLERGSIKLKFGRLQKCPSQKQYFFAVQAEDRQGIQHMELCTFDYYEPISSGTVEYKMLDGGLDSGGEWVEKVELLKSSRFINVVGMCEDNVWLVPYARVQLSSDWALVSQLLLVLELGVCALGLGCLYMTYCRKPVYVRIKEEEEEVQGMREDGGLVSEA